jgi:hypothetical protein
MTKLSRRIWGWLLGMLVGMAIIAAPIRLSATPMPYAKLLKNSNLCTRAIAAAERRHGIPDKLLYALSIKETGRWIKTSGANIAWPWTVNNGGAGEHLNSRAEALAHVRALQKAGETNIDVGCMQINLHYHPKAFKTLEQGFDPNANVDYAAHFLTALKEDLGSWEKAVRHYHSANAKKHMAYQKKVYKIWQAALGKDGAEKVKPADSKSAAARTGKAAKDAQTAKSAKTKSKPNQTSKSARLAAQKVNYAHRLMLAELRAQFPNRFGTPNRSGKPGQASSTDHFLSNWPPKDFAAQRRAQNLARAWAFSNTRRPPKRGLGP